VFAALFSFRARYAGPVALVFVCFVPFVVTLLALRSLRALRSNVIDYGCVNSSLVVNQRWDGRGFFAGRFGFSGAGSGLPVKNSNAAPESAAIVRCIAVPR
jgi:hypothetical protein